MDTNPPYLVVDAGGTKTRAVLGYSADNWLGQGLAGPGVFSAASADLAAQRIEQACREAAGDTPLGSLGQILVGAAGINDGSAAASLKTLLEQRLGVSSISVCNDADLVAYESGQRPLVVLISGTGSCATGYAIQGQVVATGRANEFLADDGSGYWIGLRLIRWLSRVLDERQSPSPLSQALLDGLMVHSSLELTERFSVRTDLKQQVASVAGLLTREIIDLDPAARAIADDAVRELSLLVKTTARKVRINESAPVAVRLVGGLLSRNSYIRNKLIQELQAAAVFEVDETVADPIHCGFGWVARQVEA